MQIEDRLIEEKGKTIKIVFAVMFCLFFIGLGVFFLYQYFNGKFNDADTFREYVKSFGYYGPLFLVFFQCFKVLYAIVPGWIGCIVGAGLFGSLGGFICSYAGICLGSIIAFCLSRQFGVSIVRQVFSEKRWNSCLRWMKRWNKRYSVFLWFAILIPISPDDFLCYFTGLTTMSFKKFVLIILTAKPLVILIYSLIFGNIL